MKEPIISAQRYLNASPWAPSSASLPQDNSDRDTLNTVLPPKALLESLTEVELLAPSDPSAKRLHEELAAREGVSPEQIFTSHSPDILFGLLCRTLLRPEDRVAIAAPDFPVLTREVLISGARYVDIGRDHNLHISHDALVRALEDPLAMVALGAPGGITGLSPSQETLTMVMKHSTWLILDARLSHYAQDLESDLGMVRRFERGVSVHSMQAWSGIRGMELGWLVGPSDLVAHLWKLQPRSPLSGAQQHMGLSCLAHHDALQARADDLKRSRTELITRLQKHLTIPDQSQGDTLFLRRKGLSGEQLGQLLGQAHIKSAYSDDHTWRDGVVIGIPTYSETPSMAKSIMKALSTLALLCCLFVPQGCSEETTQSYPTQSTTQSAELIVKAQSSEAKSTIAPKNSTKGLSKSVHRPVLVGGCQSHCRTAERALSAFLVSFSGADHHPKTADFIDTTQLIVDGIDHGKTLRALAMKGSQHERVLKVEELVKSLHTLVSQRDEATLIEAANNAQLMHRQEQAKVLVTLNDLGLQLELQTRGLEWLVTRIQQRSGHQ